MNSTIMQIKTIEFDLYPGVEINEAFRALVKESIDNMCDCYSYHNDRRIEIKYTDISKLFKIEE